MILAEELHHDEEGTEAGMRGSSSHCDYGQEGQGRMGETEGRKKGRRGRERERRREGGGERGGEEGGGRERKGGEKGGKERGLLVFSISFI